MKKVRGLFLAICTVLLLASHASATFVAPAECIATAGTIISSSRYNTCITAIETGINAAFNAVPASTLVGLPAAGTAGRLYRVTDNLRGLWVDTGSQWVSMTGAANVYDFGATGAGVVNDRTALDAAATAAAAGATGGQVVFPPGTYSIASNLTFPATVTLVFLPGARLSIPTGVTVTISGPVAPTNEQIFTWAGTGVVQFVRGSASQLLPQWWGAMGNSAVGVFTGNDDRPALQAAMRAALNSEIPLHIPAGVYSVLSVGTSMFGLVPGLGIENQTVTADQYKKLTIHGEGFGSTIIQASPALGIDVLVYLKFNGYGFAFSDIELHFPGGSATKTLLRIEGNGSSVKNIRTSGGAYGIYAYGEFTISHHLDEYSQIALGIMNSYYMRVHDLFYLTSGTAGIKIFATVAGLGSLPLNKLLSGIELTNVVVGNTVAEATAMVIDVESATRMHITCTNCVLSDNGFPTGVSAPKTGYGLVVTQAAEVTFNGGELSLTKYGNVITACGTCTFNGTKFTRNGYVASTAWAVRDLVLGPGNYTLSGTVHTQGAGAAVRAVGSSSVSILGGKFLNNVTGGLDASNVETGLPSTTIGNAVIYWEPSDASQSFTLIGNHFYAPAGHGSDGDGKIGFTINGTTAVPSAGNVVSMGNTVTTGSYGANVSLTSVTTAQKNAWHIFNDQLMTPTPIAIQSYADANAPNSTLYYSTDAAKLVWKNAAGTVNPLY